MTIPTYIRRCTACGNLNQPDILRCRCGNLLAGIDLTVEAAPAAGDVAAPARTAEPADVICPFADCAQTSPAGSKQCRYCGRALVDDAALPLPLPTASLINLPAALASRYRITAVLPAKGAEAELLLVQPNDGKIWLVAKIYRHGILPKTAVQERIARVAKQHRVDILEYGVSDGYAYELMEFCSGGSLRSMLDQPHYRHGMEAGLVRTVAEQLALALADVHGCGLVHRDLKPENILVRATQPLDLVLTDFGIASLLDATQRYTGVARTMPYAAPESLSGVIDAKADYWALGMIVLEASTGHHPFRDLSDAVILHHLTTKNIVTADIRDAPTAKLVRGLLQRDPNQRWGNTELQRWLANDPTLPEPQQQDPLAQQAYLQPYHLGDQLCYQPEQLGVALAHQWELGIADLQNAQLLVWFRDVQKDQNVVRLLLDMRSKRSTSIDVQLLTLILHLAPGIPPVWHGQSIALAALLDQVGAALNGDDRAMRWFSELYQYRVLEIYANAGNQAAGEIARRWNNVCDQFASTWETKNTILNNPAARGEQAVNIDQLMYGNARFSRPVLSSLHARVLAFCYDSKWAQRQRQNVQAMLIRLTVQCPWLVELGDPLQISQVELLAIECLLPEAEKIAARQVQHEASSRMQLDEECRSAGKTITDLLNRIRSTLHNHPVNADICTELLELGSDYFSEIATIRASGRTDLPWMEMRKSALRHENKMHLLIETIQRYTEQNAVNAGWINPRTAGVAALALFLLVLPSRRNPGTPPAVLIVVAVLVALFALWRLAPLIQCRRQIRDIAEKL